KRLTGRVVLIVELRVEGPQRLAERAEHLLELLLLLLEHADLGHHLLVDTVLRGRRRRAQQQRREHTRAWVTHHTFSSSSLTARGAPPPRTRVRRLRASRGPQALLTARGPHPHALAFG